MAELPRARQSMRVCTRLYHGGWPSTPKPQSHVGTRETGEVLAIHLLPAMSLLRSLLLLTTLRAINVALITELDARLHGVMGRSRLSKMRTLFRPEAKLRRSAMFIGRGGL
jgi:hypothetical protein